MSWLSELTGKAESLLNSLDQKAAQVLIQDNDHIAANPRVPPDVRPGPLTESHSPFLSPTKAVSSPAVQGVTSKSVEGRLTGTVQEVNLSGTKSTKKKTDKDEALFEFLNNPEPTERTKKSTPVGSTKHSRQSSASSVISNKGGKNNDVQCSPSTSGSSSNSGSSMVFVQVPDSRGSPSEMDVTALEDAMHEQPVSSSTQELESHEVALTSSSLDLENRLLKSEVGSLNQEMTSLVQRAKDSEREAAKLREKHIALSKSFLESESQIRTLTSNEQDLTEALGAKDTQLAVLRVRLDEADVELQKKQKMINELQLQRNRILQDHSDSSGIHNQALDVLRQKLTEVEATLQREQDSNKMLRQETANRQTKLEEEQKSFTEALNAVEKKYNDEKTKVTELGGQLKSLKNNLDAAKQELTEYKEKATRILQSKERLIASLREGSGALGEAAGVSSIEYDTIKQEKDMFKEEILQSRMTIENLRVELADMEAQMQQENDATQDTIRSLEDTIAEEKRRREDTEHEILKQKQELQFAVEELHKQKTTFQNRLSERESEIDKLKHQLSTKYMSSATEIELESRVKELTESLIQKQTTVETLSTEKNSLGLQLERLGQQYNDMQQSVMRTNATVIPVHDDDVRQRLPLFMREVPTDTAVTRKMKMAANSIDKFSIRLGVFLRRYPVARVFVILYMVLLHLWVMIVLLTYQPEIHSGSSAMEPKGPQV